MFRHVALLRFVDDATDAQRAAAIDGIRGLPAVVPTIRQYRFGPDAGLSPDNYDLAIVADFDDAADYETYRDHPEHQRVITELLWPILAARAAVQYEGSDGV